MATITFPLAVAKDDFVRRTTGNVLLFGVTAAALLLLLRRLPALRIVDWVYVLQHVIVLAIALVRPEPRVRDDSIGANVAVATAYLYPYALVICLSSWPARAAWPQGGLVLVAIAAGFTVVCLLTLGKRFGIRPAWRGLETSGPYHLVRHPLYLSYLMADIGYTLQLSNPLALVLLLLAWSAMIYRIVAEERVLSRDPKWPIYAHLVRHRLIPGVW
jgi:protein-S-isoprenylcysteine O-methyltransferase Ste14